MPSTHTHTHTYTYIFIYIYVYVCGSFPPLHLTSVDKCEESRGKDGEVDTSCIQHGLALPSEDIWLEAGRGRVS